MADNKIHPDLFSNSSTEKTKHKKQQQLITCHCIINWILDHFTSQKYAIKTFNREGLDFENPFQRLQYFAEQALFLFFEALTQKNTQV